MGWKGTFRTLSAIQRQSERGAQRRRNELIRQQKNMAAMEEKERAAYEVDVYENQLEVITSVHKDCGEAINWELIRATPEPKKPKKSAHHEEEAQIQLDSYKPGMADKLFKRIEKKKAELTQEVEDAKQQDENEYQEELKDYEQELAEWKNTIDLANRVLVGDTDAYIQAIQQINPLSEISGLGSSVNFHIEQPSLVEVEIRVNSEKVIPKEVKTLTKSGKLSVKDMPKTRFYELYQDYICGSVLRIARETFALLPIESIIVTAMGEILNTSNGQMEEAPILSVIIPKTTVFNFNFDTLDPSDSMKNFLHRMNFKKGIGFLPVQKITPLEITK